MKRCPVTCGMMLYKCMSIYHYNRLTLPYDKAGVHMDAYEKYVKMGVFQVNVCHSVGLFRQVCETCLLYLERSLYPSSLGQSPFFRGVFVMGGTFDINLHTFLWFGLGDAPSLSGKVVLVGSSAVIMYHGVISLLGRLACRSFGSVS